MACRDSDGDRGDRVGRGSETARARCRTRRTESRSLRNAGKRLEVQGRQAGQVCVGGALWSSSHLPKAAGDPEGVSNAGVTRSDLLLRGITDFSLEKWVELHQGKKEKSGLCLYHSPSEKSKSK